MDQKIKTNFSKTQQKTIINRGDQKGKQREKIQVEDDTKTGTVLRIF